MSDGEQFILCHTQALGLLNRPHFTASTETRSARTARLPLLFVGGKVQSEILRSAPPHSE
jgi:hypothetical protein